MSNINNNDNRSDAFREVLENLEMALEMRNLRPSTRQNYRRYILECCEWLKENENGVSINDASVSQLRRFIVHLKDSPEQGGRGLSQMTIDGYKCAIELYRQYGSLTPLDRNALPRGRQDDPLPNVPSRQDVYRLLLGETQLPLMYQMIMLTAFGCALRVSEVVSLRYCDISFSGGYIRIPADHSKNRSEGRVELSQNLRDRLYDYWALYGKGARRDDYVFPGRRPGTHISTGAVSRQFHRRLEELGWEDRGYTFHCLRHAHALQYYLSGADLFQVQIRLRHKSIQSTLVYVRLAEAMMKERKNNARNPFDDPHFAVRADRKRPR